MALSGIGSPLLDTDADGEADTADDETGEAVTVKLTIGRGTGVGA